MKKILVAAKSSNNVIGDGGNLLWHLPADLKHFYTTIQNKWLLSGRKSYESDQGSDVFFRGAGSIIVTRQKDYPVETPKVHMAHSLAAAYELAEAKKAKELMILGGAEIYRQAIVDADELIITEIHEIFVGDAVFPKIDKTEWLEIKRLDYQKDKKNWYDYSFVWYQKRI
ncbi:MAG: dihydrofolate reductase [Saprospiraceae bacterium]